MCITKMFNELKRNKAILFYIVIASALFCGCSPTTVITASWKSPSPSQKYNHILITALTSNVTVKATVENEMAAVLGSTVNVIKGIDEFPPNISNADSDKVIILNKVKTKNIDAILTISFISQETESRYIPGGGNSYNPNGFGYYGSFGGYYNYWYPFAYSQGYYVQDKIYFLETNLYDVLTEKLIWSAQSKTYSPTDLKTFSKEFSIIIAAKMKKDGVLYEELKSPHAEK